MTINESLNNLNQEDPELVEAIKRMIIPPPDKGKKSFYKSILRGKVSICKLQFFNIFYKICELVCGVLPKLDSRITPNIP
jgi:hypothetical protein